MVKSIVLSIHRFVVRRRFPVVIRQDRNRTEINGCLQTVGQTSVDRLLKTLLNTQQRLSDLLKNEISFVYVYIIDFSVLTSFLVNYTNYFVR